MKDNPLSKIDRGNLRAALLKTNQAIQEAQRAVNAGIDVEAELLKAEDLKRRLEAIQAEYGD
jgi:hypothetical protein